MRPKALFVSTLLLLGLVGGCSKPVNAKDGRREHASEHRGEHDREHGGRVGEESGKALALDASYSKVRHGLHLTMAYDAASNSFQGKVKNTTGKTIESVRVEVHLSTGKELGPTSPTDLKPGEERTVSLPAESKGFDKWSAHAEVGSGEHGHKGK